MLLNRLILCIMIVVTATFATFYGGSISYALFYLTLVIPVISFLYTLYVYSRFKIYQSVGRRTVVKGEVTDYVFQLANEDIIPYQDIQVGFYNDKSRVLNSASVKEYSLLPAEKRVLETSICCYYRGEYYVGAQTVKITDFLYLFTITYPVAAKMKIVVLPRVVNLSNIKIISANLDSKGRMNPYKNEDEEVDIEVRKYINGDNKKLIHWKASAKRHELLTRKYISIPKAKVTIFMDLFSVNEQELQRVIIEDKIIEGTLAMAQYFNKRHIRCEIIYEYDGVQTIPIHNQMDFDCFYHNCVYMRFVANNPIDQLIVNTIEKHNSLFDSNQQYIVITHYITQQLYKAAHKIVMDGNECGIIYINNTIGSNTQQFLRLIKQAGINIIIINNEDEIAGLL